METTTVSDSRRSLQHVPDISSPECLDLESVAQRSLMEELKANGLKVDYILHHCNRLADQAGHLLNSWPLACWQRAAYEADKRAKQDPNPEHVFTARILWLLTSVIQTGDAFANVINAAKAARDALESQDQRNHGNGDKREQREQELAQAGGK